jgi:hypothetical protein
MRKSTVVLPVIAVAGALAFAVPASADPNGGTPVTFAVHGATLDISVPTDTVDLGSVTASAASQAVTAHLGRVTVTDGRGGTTGWVASASAMDFTGPQNISVSGANSSHYYSPRADVTGSSAVASSDLDALYPGGAVQTATGVHGINTASWDPTISVTIPAAAVVGRYDGVVTHSVS